MGKPTQCATSVEAVRFLAADVMEVDLRMQEPPEFHFDAGQWVSIPFGPKTVRAYSIASTPRSPKVITLCADVAPGGIGSKWFRALERGQPVEFKGPTGGFVFHRTDPRRVLFVAEEIGIVPIRSILTELYETGFGRGAALIYWGREPGWLVYDAEFRSLARRYPSFSYFPAVRDAPAVVSSAGSAGAVVSGDARRGPPGPPSVIEAPAVPAVSSAGFAGAVVPGDARRGPPGPPSMIDKGEAAEVVDRLVHSVTGLVAYASGGAEMINRVRAVLMAKGLDRKSVKWEKFW